MIILICLGLDYRGYVLVDKRLNLLFKWVKEVINDSNVSIDPASADASFRRYFRVTQNNTSFVVMDAPPGKEDTTPFRQIAEQLLAMGLNVPKILECDPKQGFLLLSDLGDRTYLQDLTEKTVFELYDDAINKLVLMQAKGQENPTFLPPYDRKLLLQELDIFRQWYLIEHRGFSSTAKQITQLAKIFEFLADSALEQPSVWVHRDYHSRNLMRARENNPGILDFQDAVYGPITYDLVSLLRDCYITWDADQVLEWVKIYHHRAEESGLPVGDLQQFQVWFDLMGIQRHLKATGIFARLYHRDGKPNYLDDIPRVLNYIQNVSEKYAELKPLYHLSNQLLSG